MSRKDDTKPEDNKDTQSSHSIRENKKDFTTWACKQKTASWLTAAALTKADKKSDIVLTEEEFNSMLNNALNG